MTLRGARIVGLGESTRGTAEFFRLKHRIVEFLVREEGFTTLAMEASESAARAVDAYVRHGVSDPARLVARLGFWTWRTQEMVDLVAWLRAHNRGLPEERRVRFVGVDPQRGADSVEAITAFLRAFAPEREEDAGALEVLVHARPGSHPDPEQALRRRTEEVARHLADDDVGEHAPILVRAADRLTRSLDQSAVEESAFAVRDRAMADAVARLVDDDPAARIMIWSHNGHLYVSRSYSSVTRSVRSPSL